MRYQGLARSAKLPRSMPNSAKRRSQLRERTSRAAVGLVDVPEIEQPPVEAAKFHIRPVAQNDFGHIVGFTEWARYVVVVDLPMALLRVGDPRPPLPIIGGPEARLEADLEDRLDGIQVLIRCIRCLEKGREGFVVDVAGVAGEQEVVGTIGAENEFGGVGRKRPGRGDQGGRRTRWGGRGGSRKRDLIRFGDAAASGSSGAAVGRAPLMRS
jgi:hypothetical protein